MDLTNVIPSFDRIVGSLAEVELYTHGSSVPEASLIEVACWMTDSGLAAFFGVCGSAEELSPMFDGGPQPEDCDTEDERLIVSFADALRVCWIYQCSFILRRDNDYKTIWDSRAFGQHFDALMRLRRGWGSAGENELYLHQNAVELSLVSACIAFIRLMKKSQQAWPVKTNHNPEEPPHVRTKDFGRRRR
jgi:hypothetical protein